MAGFLGGYAVVWTAFGALAFTADLGLHAAVNASSFLADHDWAIGGSVLAIAGLFQFSRLTDACLDKCQSPMLFILKYWKPGAAGAVRLGIAHGLFCVGCCWALMLLLFVGGVMNIAWVAFLGAVVLAEKFAPPAWRAERFVAGCLVIAAAVVAFA